MKSIIKITIAAGILWGGFLSLSSCEGNASDISTTSDQISYVDPFSYDLKTLYSDSTELSTSEEDMLVFMKEEEKLARDVYDSLYNLWGSFIFHNIALSEQRHVDAVISLITFYGYADSTISEAGVFENEELQELYNSLVEKGSQSLVDAMTVGATIEDVDIYDLNLNLLETENENISLVFNHLIAGSENHMRAFVRMLTALNTTYEPQFISVELFEEILSSSITQVPDEEEVESDTTTTYPQRLFCRF